LLFFLYWFIPMLITANKNNIPFGYLKELNTNFQNQTFNHRTFLKIDPLTCDHLPKLVCIILMFGYEVMFNGGHHYPIYIVLHCHIETSQTIGLTMLLVLVTIYIVLHCHVETSQTIGLTMLLVLLTSLFLEGALRWFHNV
jgi:hypothetical protein